MRKLADLIVDLRYIIFATVILLTGLCLFLSTKVNINYDITKYLPKNSETRQGMEIMDKQFEEEKTSNLLVMFKDITGHEESLLDELKKIDGVSNVEYDDSAEYNKDNYTLYNLVVDDYSDSKTAKKVYDTVLENYEKNDVKLSGSINDENKPVLETWIVVTSIVCALIILIIMCDSYIEPFLFLFTIGLAVFINKGTNIIFGSVSNITDSICAILQMALSMDYSIMLMNRYNQEKENTNDNKKAMKKALSNSFSSISSSSVTTVVGLMALVFMSFTIGKDLGYVLAKGVLLSLICIFAVLPCLILMFDKLIIKTRKKHLNINMSKIGVLSHNLRYGALVLIIILFGISYVLKGNLKILYTATENDEVAGIFTENNQMAIIYNNKDEDKIAEICKKINSDKVNQVLCYGNTINEKLTYTGLEDKFDSLGVEVDIDDYLLKLVYYNYFASNKNIEITSQNLISFIEDKIYTNKKFNKYIDSDIRLNIEKLKYFALPSEISKKRNSNELANILGIDQESINNLLLVYHSNNTNTKMSINEFTDYVYRDVLNNKLFASYINDDIINSLNTLSKFIDKSTLNTKYNSREMASIFGMDENNMANLYLYYYSIKGVDTTLTINELTNFILNDLIIDPMYSSMFDEETINNLKLLNTFSNQELIYQKMNSEELSNILGIDKHNIELLQILINLEKENSSTYTLKDIESNSKETLEEIINLISENPEIIKDIDVEQLRKILDYIRNQESNSNANLEDLENIIEGVLEYLGIDKDSTYTISEIIEIIKNKLEEEYNANLDKFIKINDAYNSEESFTYTELANLLEMDPKYTKILYTITDYKTKGLTSSLESTINYILNNQDNPLINENLNEETIYKLNLAKSIMDKSNISMNYTEMSNIINNDIELTKNLYTLYTAKNNTLLLDKKSLVSFILEHKNDELLKSIDKETINKLTILNNVLDGVINNKFYNYKEMSNLLGISVSNMKLLYSNSDIINGYKETISLKDLVDFIITDILTNPNFNSSFTKNASNKIRNLNIFMNNTSNEYKYTSKNLYNTLSPLADTSIDYNLLDLVYLYYGSIYNYSNKYKLTIEEFINYLNTDILKDDRFTDFIDRNMRKKIINGKQTIQEAKKLLVGKEYSRVVLNTKYGLEDDDTMSFIKDLKNNLNNTKNDNYLVGNSPMAYDLDSSFGKEFNFISILTMIFIFTVVAFTFKSIIVPLILTLIIQCSVYITMGILSLFGGSVYFIALLIVQSILMGATIDYAIVFTSYYIEYRGTYNKKGALIKAYNQSIHTIITSASVLVIVTFIVGFFATAIAAKICMTISQGTLCSTLLVLFILPGVLATFDKYIIKKH